MQNWNVLKRWNVPWSMSTALLTLVIAILSVKMPLVIVNKLDQYFHFSCGDGGAAIINLGISCAAAAIIFVVLFVVTSFHQPIPNDVFHWGLKEPFNLQKGWLLWAVVVGLGYYYALIFNHPDLERIPTGWLRFLNSSKFSDFCMFCCMGILRPVVEEALYQGFLLASFTKWVSTPVAVVITAGLYALTNIPFEAKSLYGHFIAGTVLGHSYAQTRNLMTPIIIHSVYNIGLAFY